MEDRTERACLQGQMLFSCKLCLFKCQNRQQMDHHTEHYTRHLTMAVVRGAINNQERQVESPAPYKIGEKGLMKFSQVESILYVLKKQSVIAAPVPDTMDR